MWVIRVYNNHYEIGYYQKTDHGQMWVCFDKFPIDDKQQGKMAAVALCSRLNGGQ